MKEIFSFGEKPYKEFRLARPGEVKNILKERKTMQAPKEYFDDATLLKFGSNIVFHCFLKLTNVALLICCCRFIMGL